MKTSDIVKAVFVVLALGTAAVVAYNVLFGGSATDQVVVEMLCENPPCRAEFSLERGEMERMARGKQPITCPKCGSVETSQAHRCGNCQKLNPPYMHGSPPPKCNFCKQPWKYAQTPK